MICIYKYISVKYLIFAGLKNIIVLILKSDTDFTDLRHFLQQNRDFCKGQKTDLGVLSEEGFILGDQDFSALSKMAVLISMQTLNFAAV